MMCSESDYDLLGRCVKLAYFGLAADDTASHVDRSLIQCRRLGLARHDVNLVFAFDMQACTKSVAIVEVLA